MVVNAYYTSINKPDCSLESQNLMIPTFFDQSYPRNRCFERFLSQHRSDEDSLFPLHNKIILLMSNDYNSIGSHVQTVYKHNKK